MVRKYTNRLLELIEEGILTYEMVLSEMLCFLSEDTIKEFCLEAWASENTYLFKGVEE